MESKKILIAPFAKKLREKTQPNPKDYPFTQELVDLLQTLDYNLIQVGVEGESQHCFDFRKNLSFQGLCDLVKSCHTFIGVDSYLQHLAWFLNKRGIVLWGQSNPKIFGHSLHCNLLKDPKYIRSDQFQIWEAAHLIPEAFVSPEQVIQCLKDNF